MNKVWLTIEDLGNYLQVPETKIRNLVKQGAIPFSDKLGSPRFFKPEIDEWMQSPVDLSQELSYGEKAFQYRGKPIKEYTLAASKVLCGHLPWTRLHGFIRETVEKVDQVDRPYLRRQEFEPFIKHSLDYTRLCFWLGLIKKEREGRIVLYYPTEFAGRISVEYDLGSMKRIILESILNIIGNGLEEIPEERHALFLLWYYMKLRSSGEVPAESRFNRGAETTAYPTIRLNFAKGLCEFLFSKDRSKEQEFLEKWDKYIKLIG